MSMYGWYAENASLQGCNLVEQCRSNCRGAIFCLVQSFRTKKMVAYRIALRELRYDYRDIGGRVTPGAVTEKASAALQLL